MCLKYKGVDYDYAFEFKVPVGSRDRLFRVVISKFREDSRDFSGLCLENELRVVSEENVPFEAFFDIINSTIEITVEGEKDILSRGQPLVPLLKVTDKNFLDKFEMRKKSRESMDYYELLRIFFENPNHIKDPTHKDEDSGLRAHYDLMFFLYFLPLKAPSIKDAQVFII